MSTSKLILCGMGLCVLAAQAGATIWHVPGEFPSINSALSFASAGDEVQVAAGVYHESIHLTKDVSIYGAGPGLTTIDATGLGNPFWVGPAGWVVGPNTRIQGLTLTGGSPYGDERGCGVQVEAGSHPHLENLVITGNHGSVSGGVYCNYSSVTMEGVVVEFNTWSTPGGAALYLTQNSVVIDPVILTNVTVRQNQLATSGFSTAVYCYYGEAFVNNLLITDNGDDTQGIDGLKLYQCAMNQSGLVVSGNSGQGVVIDGGNQEWDGVTISGNEGGIWLKPGRSLRLTNSLISGNSGSFSNCGLRADVSTNLTLADCVFSGNSSYYAGGLFFNGANLEVSDCLFEYNSARDYGGGMSIKSATGSVLVERTELRGNQVTNDFASGGAGAYVYGCSPTFQRVLFADNHSNYMGGALYVTEHVSWPVMLNCTFTGNSSSSGTGHLAELKYNSDLTMVNCIVWNHGSVITNSGSNSSVVVSHCNIEGGQAALDGVYSDIFWEDGNINENPLLDANGELTAGSPCIDAGTGYFAWANEIVVDMGAGDYDGTDPDMGWKEAQAAAPPEAPQHVLIQASGDMVTLNWDPVQGASGYRVYHKSSAYGAFTELAGGELAGTSWSGLMPGSAGYYRVTAVAE